MIDQRQRTPTRRFVSAIFLLVLFILSVNADAAEPKIALGYDQALVIRSDGTIWAWGYNPYGEVGDGTTENRASPVPIAPGSTFAAVSAGRMHSLAIKTDGTLWAWGNNDFGQLGNGTTVGELSPVQIAPGSTFAAVSAGMYHSLAIKMDGTLWAWGDNSSGLLGNGTTVNELRPVQVAPGSTFMTVAAGDHTSLAIKTDGTLWAWGIKVGDGTYDLKTSPVQVAPGSTFTAVTAGAGTNHAIKTDGTLWGWGDNHIGELGNGTWASSELSPVQIAPGSTFTAVETGYSYTLAIKTDGTVWGWGDNYYGQLGNGTLSSELSPVQFSPPDTFSAVVAGQFKSIALRPDGTLWVWGLTTFWSSGHISLTGEYVMDVAVGPGPFVVTPHAGAYGSISPGTPQTVDITSVAAFEITPEPGGAIASVTGCNGSLSGSTYTTGPITADCDVTASFLIPLALSVTGRGTVHTSPGPDLFCFADCEDVFGSGETVTLTAVPGPGAVFAGWGGDPDCLDGVVVMDGARTCTAVFTGTLAAEELISAGEYHTLAITKDGSLWTWVGTPVEIAVDGGAFKGATWKSWESGVSRTLVITPAGVLWEWGAPPETAGAIPHRVSFGSPPVAFADVAAGRKHALAIKTDGTLWAWGNNDLGQLGDGTTENRPDPVSVASGSTFIAVAAGGMHSLAIKTDGTLWAWGSNSYGQVGDGTKTQRTSPVPVAPDSTFTAVAAGSYHSLAIKTDGTLWAWGANWGGQLGDSTREHKTLPVQIAPGSTFIAVAAGYKHTLAIKTDGTLWAWGYNYYGQLGNGSTSDKAMPVPVAPGNTFTAVAAGFDFSRAIRSDSTLWGWGKSTFDPLRSGAGANRTHPVWMMDMGPVAPGPFTVTVSAGLHGNVSPAAPQTVDRYSTVSFEITPDPGYGVRNVTGCMGIFSGSTFTTGPITSDCHVTAGLVKQWPLSIAVNGPGTVHSSPGMDLACTSNCDASYFQGVSITLNADPGPGAVFAGWSGDPDCSDGVVLMDSAKTCTAAFSQSTWSLLVSTTGQGVITSSPAGIHCGPTCSADFTSGSTVLLTADPAQWWRFNGWSGACAGAGACEVILDSDAQVSATFVAYSRIGVYRDGYWYLDVDRSWSWDGTSVDALGMYGIDLPAGVPVTGDWNGDGISEKGLFTEGLWRFDMNGNDQWDRWIDRSRKLGIAGDLPVTGDWNGDGVTEIGVYRGNGYWYLDTNGDLYWDLTFKFGIAGDIPVTGDWNGDGVTEIGVYRGNGYWYLDTNNNRDWDKDTDETFKFGIAGDLPMTGDWNGDRTTEVGLFRGNGEWFIDEDGDRKADRNFKFGIMGDTPVVGHW